ncbi:MAG: hypothetical protein J6A83_06390 [Clostridia bacterium]|nr:hypothetical protein [Clostridia bacterium]
MTFRTNEIGVSRYCVSPAYTINMVIMLMLTVLSLVGMCVFAVYFDLTVKETIIGYLFILFFYSLSIVPCSLMAKKRLSISYLYRDRIESRIFGKTKCSYAWNEIKHIRFIKSRTSVIDLVPAYIVLSKDEITPRENWILSLDIKREILIPLNRRNIDNVMKYLSFIGIPSIFNNNFEVLYEFICERGDILFRKLGDNTWEKEIIQRAE